MALQPREQPREVSKARPEGQPDAGLRAIEDVQVGVCPTRAQREGWTEAKDRNGAVGRVYLNAERGILPAA